MTIRQQVVCYHIVMIHSLFFVLAILLGPVIVAPIIQRICRPNGQIYPAKITYPWSIAALLVALIGTTTNHLIPDAVLGNFYMHAIGGGVTSFCLAMSVIKQSKFRFSTIQLALIMLAVACTLGVVNELFEYALELATHGNLIFSLDTHDTWRDLLANTVGMASAFILGMPLKAYTNGNKEG